MNNVLVVVDMQNDFIDGSLGTNEALSIVDNVVKEINKPIYNHIIYTLDSHDNNYLDTLEGKNLPVKHCVYGEIGHDLNKKVKEAIDNRSKDSFVTINQVNKPTFGSFDIIPLIGKVDSITFCGVCTDICVISNAIILRAAFKDMPMYYVKQACAGTSKENHEAACKVMDSCQIFDKKDS